MKARNIIAIIILLFVTACFNLNKLSLYNLSGQYTNTSFTRLDVLAFNHATDSVTIFIPLVSDDLAITTDDDTGEDYTMVSLAYEMFETYESKHILDSSSLVIRQEAGMPGDTLVQFRIRYPEKRKYILKITLTDLNRVDHVERYLHLDNTSVYSANNYYLFNAQGEIIYSNIINRHDGFRILSSDTSSEYLYVRYYNRDFPLALPPFLEETETVFDYNADSVFRIGIQDGLTALLHFTEEGFYHIQSDTSSRQGYTVYRFPDGFPDVTTAGQMLQPLRYITTRNEFEDLSGAPDLKLAIDNFWLSNAGNPARARNMIQKYYARVADANRFFSSYLEGWKTDRGIIYIVYGQPAIVYRGDKTEEWIYGEKGNANSIKFRFVKVPNPFTENDYSLVKSPSYKEKWYNIVGTWRR